MTISLKHSFTSAKSDGSDATLVQPSSWNAEHTITAAAGKVLGRDTSGSGAVQELPIAVTSSGNVGIGTTSPYQKLQVIGSGIFGASGVDPSPYSNTLSLLGASNAATSLYLWKISQASAQIGFRSSTDQNLYILNSYNTGLISNSPGIAIDMSGNVGIGTTSPSTTLHANGPIRCGSYTVNTLPSASTVGAGSRAFVTDANATTFHSTVASGGANKVSVISDGTIWLIGG